MRLDGKSRPPRKSRWSSPQSANRCLDLQRTRLHSSRASRNRRRARADSRRHVGQTIRARSPVAGTRAARSSAGLFAASATFILFEIAIAELLQSPRLARTVTAICSPERSHRLIPPGGMMGPVDSSQGRVILRRECPAYWVVFPSRGCRNDCRRGRRMARRQEPARGRCVRIRW
jgi:hypothetical protein